MVGHLLGKIGPSGTNGAQSGRAGQTTEYVVMENGTSYDTK